MHNPQDIRLTLAVLDAEIARVRRDIATAAMDGDITQCDSLHADVETLERAQSILAGEQR